MIEERLTQEFDRVARSQVIDVAEAMHGAHVQVATMRRRRRALIAIAVAATILGVAGIVGVLVHRTGQADNPPPMAGQPLLTTAKLLDGYPAAEVVGVVQVVDDCIIVGGRVALFPPGTTLADGVISLPTGTTTQVGSKAEWSGGYFEVESAREMAGSDDVFRSLQRCADAAGAKEVALITP